MAIMVTRLPRKKASFTACLLKISAQPEEVNPAHNSLAEDLRAYVYPLQWISNLNATQEVSFSYIRSIRWRPQSSCLFSTFSSNLNAKDRGIDWGGLINPTTGQTCNKQVVSYLWVLRSDTWQWSKSTRWRSPFDHLTRRAVYRSILIDLLKE